jgi:hypothetical protein
LDPSGQLTLRLRALRHNGAQRLRPRHAASAPGSLEVLPLTLEVALPGEVASSAAADAAAQALQAELLTYLSCQVGPVDLADSPARSAATVTLAVVASASRGGVAGVSAQLQTLLHDGSFTFASPSLGCGLRVSTHQPMPKPTLLPLGTTLLVFHGLTAYDCITGFTAAALLASGYPPDSFTVIAETLGDARVPPPLSQSEHGNSTVVKAIVEMRDIRHGLCPGLRYFSRGHGVCPITVQAQFCGHHSCLIRRPSAARPTASQGAAPGGPSSPRGRHSGAPSGASPRPAPMDGVTQPPRRCPDTAAATAGSAEPMDAAEALPATGSAPVSAPERPPPIVPPLPSDPMCVGGEGADGSVEVSMSDVGDQPPALRQRVGPGEPPTDSEGPSPMVAGDLASAAACQGSAYAAEHSHAAPTAETTGGRRSTTPTGLGYAGGPRATAAGSAPRFVPASDASPPPRDSIPPGYFPVPNAYVRWLHDEEDIPRTLAATALDIVRQQEPQQWAAFVDDGEDIPRPLRPAVERAIRSLHDGRDADGSFLHSIRPTPFDIAAASTPCSYLGQTAASFLVMDALRASDDPLNDHVDTVVLGWVQDHRSHEPAYTSASTPLTPELKFALHRAVAAWRNHRSATLPLPPPTPSPAAVGRSPSPPPSRPRTCARPSQASPRRRRSPPPAVRPPTTAPRRSGRATVPARDWWVHPPAPTPARPAAATRATAAADRALRGLQPPSNSAAPGRGAARRRGREP